MFGYDYFISYSHEDSEDYVRNLHHQLSQTHIGFLDSSSEGLLVGSELSRDVTKALRRSKILIVVYTDSIEEKQWTKLECRYFKAIHANRPFIPISARESSEELRRRLSVLFDDDADDLSLILQTWLKETANTSDLPSSADLDPVWAVESDTTELCDSLPSKRIVKQLKDAFFGASVPRKGAYAVASLVLITLLSMCLGWTQFANERANTILADLSSRIGKSNIREVQQEGGTEFMLVADIRESDVSDSASMRGVDVKTEFEELMQKINSYDFYRRCDVSSIGYRGISLSLFSIPNAVPEPTFAFPRTMRVVRLTGDQLNDNWLDRLQEIKTCDLLALTFDQIRSEQMFIDVVNSLRVRELRIRKCRQIDLATFEQFEDAACLSLNSLSISALDNFVVDSTRDEIRWASFLNRSPNLSFLRMRELSRCRLSSIFSKEISQHPSLCQEGGELHLDSQMLNSRIQIETKGDIRVYGSIRQIKEIKQIE